MSDIIIFDRNTKTVHNLDDVEGPFDNGGWNQYDIPDNPVFAAAPEMLAALEDCADALSIFHHKSEGNSAVKKARAAIKAAK